MPSVFEWSDEDDIHFRESWYRQGLLQMWRESARVDGDCHIFLTKLY